MLSPLEDTHRDHRREVKYRGLASSSWHAGESHRTHLGLGPCSTNTNAIPPWDIHCIRLFMFPMHTPISIRSLLLSVARHFELTLVTLFIIFHRYLLMSASPTVLEIPRRSSQTLMQSLAQSKCLINICEFVYSCGRMGEEWERIKKKTTLIGFKIFHLSNVFIKMHFTQLEFSVRNLCCRNLCGLYR